MNCQMTMTRKFTKALQLRTYVNAAMSGSSERLLAAEFLGRGVIGLTPSLIRPIQPVARSGYRISILSAWFLSSWACAN